MTGTITSIEDAVAALDRIGEALGATDDLWEWARDHEDELEGRSGVALMLLHIDAVTFAKELMDARAMLLRATAC